MKSIRYILCLLFFFVVATTYVYSQSWERFFDQGKVHYEQGNYEKAIKNLEIYLNYETANPKAEAKHLLEQAKKRLAEKADTPTNAEQVAQADITQLTEKPSPKVPEQPTQADKPHEEYFIETALGLNVKMIYVEGGTFMMGAPDDDMDAEYNEKPRHKVTLDSYYIAEFEVTQSQWTKIMGTTIHRQLKKKGADWEDREDYGKGDNIPIYSVNWFEANEFCHKLSNLTGKIYRLPTEAQWEFAARGGNKSKGYKFSGSNSIDAVAWHKGNSDNKIHPVGQKLPNELGIYDMTGNIEEWCQDWAYRRYTSEPQTNPQWAGQATGFKIHRGGNWEQDPNSNSDHKIYDRMCRAPEHRGYYGFRVVCIPD